MKVQESQKVLEKMLYLISGISTQNLSSSSETNMSNLVVLLVLLVVTSIIQIYYSFFIKEYFAPRSFKKGKYANTGI